MKSLHSLALSYLDSIFNHLTDLCILFLTKIDEQYPFQADRWPTSLTRRLLEVGRRQRIKQALPLQ